MSRLVAAGKTKIFLLPNATFFVELVLFLLLFLIIAKFILPRIQRPLRERQALIAKQIEDAERAKQQLAEAERAYQDALVDARTEAAQIREDARAEAQRTVDQLRAQALEEQARIVARGEEQLAGQRTSILRELRGEIGTVAVELSEKLLGQPLRDDAQVRTTVDSYLAGLDAEDHARTGAGA